MVDFGGAFEKTLDELIADERIEASEGFVQDDEARVETRERRLRRASFSCRERGP